MIFCMMVSLVCGGAAMIVGRLFTRVAVCFADGLHWAKEYVARGGSQPLRFYLRPLAYYAEGVGRIEARRGGGNSPDAW